MFGIFPVLESLFEYQNSHVKYYIIINETKRFVAQTRYEYMHTDASLISRAQSDYP